MATSRVSYVCGSHYTTNLLHRVKIRAETTMHRKDLLVNDGSDRQAVEAVREGLP